jgi:NADPH:quinone reductase-like Zn-dependent oxidoreductase
MSKALLLKEPKGDLVLSDIETPTPKAGEVLIENVAVALNPVDWKQRGEHSYQSTNVK